MGKQKNNIALFVRALRLPFIVVSILPFVYGSLIDRAGFNYGGFLLGLLAVISTHLSANLINDYADSKSGADWQDKHYYAFFGGSKLIQENLLSEGFYLKAAASFALIAAASVVLLAFNLRDISVIGFFLLIILLSWSYSAKPLQLAYRGLGELVIFTLFGPALVMGGYFIQTGIFPDGKSFILSLPLGLLTAAILFANEVPDFKEDSNAGKLNFVSLVGAANSFQLYYLLVISALLTIAWGVGLGYLNPLAILAFGVYLLMVRAARILRGPADKMGLTASSRLTIAIHHLTGLALILGII
jgi:1,4-dihydroxy-2-naphthoate octaprenyltransferase